MCRVWVGRLTKGAIATGWEANNVELVRGNRDNNAFGFKQRGAESFLHTLNLLRLLAIQRGVKAPMWSKLVLSFVFLFVIRRTLLLSGWVQPPEIL